MNTRSRATNSPLTSAERKVSMVFSLTLASRMEKLTRDESRRKTIKPLRKDKLIYSPLNI